jgi:hypothetical protein
MLAGKQRESTHNLRYRARASAQVKHHVVHFSTSALLLA